MFKHWEALEDLGARLRWNNFYVDAVTEVFPSFCNPLRSHSDDVISEMMTLT